MEWIADPTAWVRLGTLILREIVLGMDNLIFIAILIDKLPPTQRERARIVGLSLALLMRGRNARGNLLEQSACSNFRRRPSPGVGVTMV